MVDAADSKSVGSNTMSVQVRPRAPFLYYERFWNIDKNYYEYLTKDFPENSVRKACYDVREFMRSQKYGTMDNAVTEEEFYKSLDILLAYSYEQSNDETVVEQYYCDSECERNNGIYGFCPGEFQINSKSRVLCRHFMDSSDK